MTIKLYLGDMRGILPLLAENSIDSAVIDGPYNLDTIRKRLGKPGSAPIKYGTDGAYSRVSRGFMGKEWDSDIINDPATWGHVLRVLKPGAHLLSFGHGRTFHRMATAIEDAGFEIRDQIMWIYGSGFPKAHAISPGWKTALKPAHEPICVARKPLSEKTNIKNMERWGVGGFNIDGCRVPTDDVIKAQFANNIKGHAYNSGKTEKGPWCEPSPGGRFPANIIHDGSDVVLNCFPDTKGAGAIKGTEPSPLTNGIYGEFSDRAPSPAREPGNASRFFYCAKASASERPWHCNHCGHGGASNKPARCPACWGHDVTGHPTVKPQALMRYLCRLVTPPGGLVLDCFSGSGSTLQAARSEGFRSIGIELDKGYHTDILRRLGL